MIGAARGLADSLVQVLLSLIVAIMFWTNGDGLVSVLYDALRGLGSPVAEHELDVYRRRDTRRRLRRDRRRRIQAVLLAIGLAVAGVPGAGTLGLVALLLAISQIGGPLLT